jgi:hypothetical protein
MRAVGRFGDNGAERESFGSRPPLRSVEVYVRSPWLLAISARQNQRRMLVAVALAEGEELGSNVL